MHGWFNLYQQPRIHARLQRHARNRGSAAFALLVLCAWSAGRAQCVEPVVLDASDRIPGPIGNGDSRTIDNQTTDSNTSDSKASNTTASHVGAYDPVVGLSTIDWNAPREERWLSGAGAQRGLSLLNRPAIIRGQSTEEEPLVTDRPDFTEASSTVGRGVVQLETGYTYVYNDDPEDQSILNAHAYDQLYRIGLAEFVELRIAWLYLWEETKSVDHMDGAADLYLGTKIDLMPQNGFRPEAAIILQGTVPTGATAFTTNEVEAGVNLLYSWGLPNGWSLGGSTGVDTFSEDEDDFLFYHQSLALGRSLTEQFGMYAEYFGLYFDQRESNAPTNYFNAGFTYLLNPNVQFDIRAGVGLNSHADDFFTGSGVSIRF
jgi:hypothetical protein